MASNASKIDAAAEKAYAEAAAKKAADKPTAKAETVSEKAIVEADAPKAKAAPAKKAAPVAQPAAAKPAPTKSVAKKVAAKKADPKKAAVKKSPAKKAAAKPAAPAKTATQSPVKETIMTKAQEKVQAKAADYTAQLKEGFADLQTRAKTAYDKSQEIAADMGEFTKANVEAVVESGKILAAGMQDMGKAYVEDAKGVVETVTADVKEVAAVKSPTEFIQLQTKIVSRNFDATVAAVSKGTEAWVKLANEAFAPISSRVSVAVDKVRKAA